MATPRKSDLDRLTPKGTAFESIVVKAIEDPEEKAARLARERWSFYVKELAAHLISFLILIVIGVYCCFVVARYGVNSAEARTVFPLITTLFGGVVGVIVGKAAK